MLHEFIAFNREEIIRRCRAKVVTRSVPTGLKIDHGVPVFLDQLIDALRLAFSRLGVVARWEKAVVALLDARHFFGEGCLAGQTQRMARSSTCHP